MIIISLRHSEKVKLSVAPTNGTLVGSASFSSDNPQAGNLQQLDAKDAWFISGVSGNFGTANVTITATVQHADGTQETLNEMVQITIDPGLESLGVGVSSPISTLLLGG